MKKIKKISMLLLAMGALVGVAACDSKAQTPATDNTSNNTNESSDKTPTDGGEITPSTGGDTTPTDGSEITPSTGGDTTPSTGGDSGEAGGTEQITTKYKVTFNTNGGSSINDQNIESGKTISSVSTTKEGCTFAGWYTDSSLTKSFNVTTPITAATTLYAKWNVTITFNTNSGTAITSQTIASGEAISTVSTSRSGYDFAGWYTDSELKNEFDVATPITKSLTLYAKWKLNAVEGQIIKVAQAYNEGAYILFEASSKDAASNSTISYSADGTSWTNIDKDLIRYDSDAKIARADILGLKAGSYVVKVNNGEKVSTSSTLNVSADDRSGYAHFNNTTGVGAYNNDGTLKNNAVVVYVNEANKNTVQANGYTGIANILKNQSKSSKPLSIRIIGTVGAAMWASPTYSTSSYNEATTSTIRGNNGSYLELKNYEESALLNTFNVLDESKYSKLNNLTNKIKYDSSKKEFDSYYNMLDITSASNVTVEGIGTDATIAQWGFTWKNSSSIEVKNLTFTDYPEDACAFEGSADDLATGTTALDVNKLTSGYYWIHNNTFNIGKNNWDVCSEHDKGDGDGSTDIKKIRNATYSYNKYIGTHKTGLVGGSEKHVSANLTFHHNYYTGCKSRMPYARQANMHMYNNYYDSSTGTTMQIYAGAYAFIENCYFKNDKKTFEFNNKGYTTPAVKSYNNIFNGSKNYDISGVSIVTDRAQTVENGNIFNKNFDTDSSFFYYDSTNKKSDVTIMNQASELPTLIPTVAGAGILPNFNLGSFTDIDTSTSGSESGSGSTDTPTKYTVTFETNGGTTITSQEVTSGNTISTVSTSKDNYTFAGWYTDSSLTKSFDVTTPITGPITLYAKWEATSSQSQTGNTLTLAIPSTTEAVEKTENFTAGDFTVTASSEKKVTINKDNIALGGAGTTTYRSIIANVGTTSEITITIKITGGSNDRYLVVADEAGNSLSETLVTGETLTIKASGSTKYYLYSKKSGLNVYTLTITY